MKTARVVNSAGGCCFIDVHCVEEGNSCFFPDLSGQVNAAVFEVGTINGRQLSISLRL